MPQPSAPDFEAYARSLQTTMQTAIAEAEALQVQAHAERDAAHADRMAAQDILHELDRAARTAAQDYVDQHRTEINAKLRIELQTLVATRLLNGGQPAAAVAKLLQLPVPWVERLR